MTTDFPKFKIRASRCCAAVQEKLQDRVITRESNVSVCLVKLQNSKHSGKMWLNPCLVKKNSSVQSSQLLHQVSA